MGYQERVDLYLSLTRKELQGLCKRNSLPANRSHVELANSLASLFKACDPDRHAVSASPDENLRREGLDCSSFAPKDISLKPSIAANMQGTTMARPRSYQWHENGIKNSPSESFELRNFMQRPQNHTPDNHGTTNLRLTSYGNKRLDQCSTATRIVSSDGSSAKAPSFEFFAMSEDGIDLCVDLSSSPSQWINSLKAEVCIYEKAEHCTSELLCNQLRGLADAVENTKCSSNGNVGTDFQSNVGEINTQCTYSSLSSVVSENCHSEPCVPDATFVTSRSYALAPASSPLESSEGGDGSRLVSSSCSIPSCPHSHMASDIPSCCRDKKLLQQEAVTDSFKVKKCARSVHDASLKSTNDLNVSSPEASRNLDSSTTINSSGADSNNVKVAVLGETLANSSGKNKPSTWDSIGKMRNHGSSFQISAKVGPMEGQQEIACLGDMLFSGQLVLDCPLADAESEVGSADHLLNIHQSGNHGTSAKEDPMSATSDGQDRSIPVKDNLECSVFQNLLQRISKRPHSQEVVDDIQNKKQHLHGDDGAATNIISMNNGPKESQCDQLLRPRRSTRLSKV